MAQTKTLNKAGGADYDNLADAIDAWEASADQPWTIEVVDGTYDAASDKGITLAPSNANSSLTIKASSADSTSVFFDGSSSGGWITTTSNNFDALTLIDLNISNYHRTTHGGAIYIRRADDGAFDLELDACVFESNSCTNASQNGGAIYLATSGGSFIDVGSTYDANTATGSGGAAIVSSLTGSMTFDVSGSTYWSNTAQSNGGAVYVAGSGGATFLFDSCDFGHVTNAWGNSQTADVATFGGAICMSGNDVNTLTVTDSNFYDNGSSTNTLYGGAIGVLKAYEVNTSGCYFKSNQAKTYGGAVFGSTGTFRFDGNKYESNTNATSIGGACYMGLNVAAANGTLALDFEEANSAYITNVCSTNASYGGGLCFQTQSGDGYNANVINCTFSGNEVQGANSYGGGVALVRYATNPVLNIYNCILWDNVCDNYEDIYSNDTNNVVAVNNTTYQAGEIAEGGGGSISESNNSNADPLFVGGGDYSLQVGSPALDAGNNSYVSGYSYDILGNARISNATVDMGAYELQVAIGGRNGVLFSNIASINGVDVDTIASISGVDIA